MSKATAQVLELRGKDEALYLGPARVIGVKGLRPEVELPDGRAVVAEMALAFPYNFAVDDVLLLVGRGDGHYVIGVLSARGEVSLRFQGNVKLHAVGGCLDLIADEGLRLRSPELELKARKLKIAADSVVEKVTSFYQTVREVLRVHAGEKHEVVQGLSSLQAERASIATREIITINGKEVHLG
jgi:hypothetical protein